MSAVLVPMVRTFRAGEFDAVDLAERKGDETISVCLPARDEAATVGAIVESIVEHLVHDTGLVDQVLVIDDHSSDRTAAVAADAGAEVLAAESILPDFGPGFGKGEALWKSLYASVGDLVAWCDADVRDFDPNFVVGLLGPLLTRPELTFVKGFYDRPLDSDGSGGGRVTELLARPMLALAFPQLAAIVQPLAGEYAGRRSALERLPFVEGYGVDIGLLIDVAERFGIESIAQVDLGVRMHRNRPLDELAPQAAAVLRTMLRRADPDLVLGSTLARPNHPSVEIDDGERPCLLEVPDYVRRHPPAGESSELRA